MYVGEKMISTDNIKKECFDVPDNERHGNMFCNIMASLLHDDTVLADIKNCNLAKGNNARLRREACNKKSSRSNSKKHKATRSVKDRCSDKCFICDICEEEFTKMPLLKTHQLIHSSSDKLFKCDICDNSYRRKSSLDGHYLTHCDEEDLTCDICDKSFLENSALKTHQLIHMRGKRFICKICQKKFRMESSLATHHFTHSGFLRCDICDKTFSHISTLYNHKLSHIYDRSFNCVVVVRDLFTEIP